MVLHRRIFSFRSCFDPPQFFQRPEILEEGMVPHAGKFVGNLLQLLLVYLLREFFRNILSSEHQVTDSLFSPGLSRGRGQ